MGPESNYFLEIMSGIEQGKRIALPDGAVTIGRAAGNTIALHPAEKGVSGNHAIIYKSPGRIVLQDLQSTNSTFVNDRRISEQVLSPGDTIGLGAAGPKLKLMAGLLPPGSQAANRSAAPAQAPLSARTVENLQAFFPKASPA
ncbi:MAG: FHA domain-containing protein, partial [Chitinivibrionales bacterium]|nr:FHA domain-containing protein [Chitinivibrionales bacterium]